MSKQVNSCFPAAILMLGLDAAFKKRPMRDIGLF
jgi:hypothetical protein